MNARVPTLPTPTTLRAMSTNSNRSSSVAAVVRQGLAVLAELVVDHGLELVDGVAVAGGEVPQRDRRPAAG